MKIKHNGKHNGFTLAEVLITLGIIGVVAAITIPGLMTKLKNHQIEAVLKEDYSILNQMMISAYDDGAVNVSSTSNNMTVIKSWFQEYLLPYIKVSSVCYDETGCWSQNVKTLKGTKHTSYTTGCGQLTVSFILNNGSYICMDDYSKSNLKSNFGIETDSKMAYAFYIDTNGDRQPNVIGKDIYILVFKEETEKMVPAGSDMTTDEIKQNCSSEGSGYWCLSLIKNQGWKVVEN